MKESSFLSYALHQEMAKIFRERFGRSFNVEGGIPEDLDPEITMVVGMLSKPPFSNCENGFRIIEKHWFDPFKRYEGDAEKKIPAKLNISASASDKVREEVYEAIRILNEAGFRTMVHFVERHVCTVEVGEYTYWRLGGIKKLVDPNFDPRAQDRRFVT